MALARGRDVGRKSQMGLFWQDITSETRHYHFFGTRCAIDRPLRRRERRLGFRHRRSFTSPVLPPLLFLSLFVWLFNFFVVEISRDRFLHILLAATAAAAGQIKLAGMNFAT